MINWKITINETGKPKSYFYQYPKTRKKVLAICDECYKSRWVIFWSYRPLCQSCSNKLRNKK